MKRLYVDSEEEIISRSDSESKMECPSMNLIQPLQVSVQKKNQPNVKMITLLKKKVQSGPRIHLVSRVVYRVEIFCA